MLENDEAFIAYITENITKMRASAKLGAGKEVNFYELQEVLTEYMNTRLELDKMVTLARLEFQYEKEDFDQWYAEEFVKIRQRENRAELAASKWVGAKELEYMVRAEFARPYRIKRRALHEMEQRYEFLKDLKESWDSFRYILSTLSNNVRTEVGLDNVSGRLTH